MPLSSHRRLDRSAPQKQPGGGARASGCLNQSGDAAVSKNATVYNDPMTTANENERLAADVADLKVGQTQLQAGQARLEAGQARLENRVGRLEGTVGRLVGAELEREVHANIVNIASRELGLNRVRILQSKIVARSPEFQDAIDDAEEQNRITDVQGSHLERADVILAARRKSSREAVHVVAEVSGLIGDRDITRARERADTLAAIKGTPVIPAVVGGSIAPIQRTAADRHGVSVIVTPGLVP